MDNIVVLIQMFETLADTDARSKACHEVVGRRPKLRRRKRRRPKRSSSRKRLERLSELTARKEEKISQG